MTELSVTLMSEGLSAEVSAQGAELVRLRDREGRDLLWNGDPAFWNRRAPLLFPIVGRLPGDALLHEGGTYPMTQHGFARDSVFEVFSTAEDRATFVLRASEASRRQYPFDFELSVTYALAGTTLTITADVRNPGTRVLPASFGFHPAFLWPLPYGGTRADHRIVFEKAEVAPVHRPVGGLLSAATEPNPAMEGSIALTDALFAADALIFTELRSHHLFYGVPGEPGLEVAFPGMPHLGLWSKRGAPFVCIEPWFGYATPEGDTAAFVDKPGLAHIAPGAEQRFAMSVRWLPDVGR
ncbi:aldose 1-epimerase family protein [Ancylobacter terrae]|uniref:aldose 1-epimerase family protein n=1 Tax=Ancylobacter sp. sgz301288 TaxID=3342077 RepID=UPI00385F6D97